MIYTINANELPPTIRATYSSIRRRIVSCSLTINRNHFVQSKKVEYGIMYRNEWNSNILSNTWTYDKGWNMRIRN